MARRRSLFAFVLPALLAAAYGAGCDEPVAHDLHLGYDDAAPPVGATGDATITADSAAGDGGAADAADAAHETGPRDATVPPVDAGFSPSQLAGLVLWLDARRNVVVPDGGVPDGGGASAVTWGDRSPAANNAASVGAPSVTSADAGIGGRGVMHFDGTDYFVVADSASLRLGFDDVVIATVARHTTPTDAGVGYGVVYAKRSAGSPASGAALLGNTGTGSGALLAQLVEQQATLASGGATYNNGQPFYATMRRFGAASRADAGDAGDASVSATLALRVNGADGGVASGPQFAVDLGATGQPLYVGGSPAGENLTGDIAELIVVRGVTDLQVAELEAYLKARYGL